MRNGKLQVGIVGVGGIGRDQHMPGWARVPFVELVAAADSSDEALERAGKLHTFAHTFNDWQQLVALEELDIVDICTPNTTHCPITLTALQHGKHVLCEKPLAVRSEDVVQMTQAAQRNGKLLMAGQHLRFDPVCRQLKGLIDAGLLGNVYYSRAQWMRRRYLPARPTFTEKRLSGGGPGFDIGVHVLDLAYWFLGAPQPATVSACVESRLAQRSDISGSWGDWDRSRFDVEDFAAGFVRFHNGAVLMLETSWLAFQPEKEITRLQCFGDCGGLTWPDGILVGETNCTPWEMRLSETPKIAPHHEEILQFSLAVRDGKPSPIPVEESLAVIQILEALYRSGAEKKEVTVERV